MLEMRIDKFVKMISIQVLGSGCARCSMVAEIAARAAETLGIEAGVVKVTDSAEIGNTIFLRHRVSL